MPQLFSISFTTKTMVKKFGEKGKFIGETVLENPITMHALPHSTAMAYSGCDNFTITPYVMEETRAHAKGVGNGTKRVSYSGVDHSSTKANTQQKQHVSKLEDAAKTGNMGAALNV